jgi:hypothetical protein
LLHTQADEENIGRKLRKLRKFLKAFFWWHGAG